MASCQPVTHAHIMFHKQLKDHLLALPLKNLEAGKAANEVTLGGRIHLLDMPISKIKITDNSEEM